MRIVAEEFGDVKADAARADDGHAATDFCVALKHIDIAQRLVVPYPFNVRIPGHHAGGQHDFVECVQVVR